MMRRISLILGIGLMLLSVSAQAQVASSYGMPVAPPEKPLAGYDNGFVLRSADDEFRLQIYSRVQFQHFYQNIRTAGATDTNTFRLRRSRFYLFGQLFKDFEFSTWLSHGTGATAASQIFWWGDMTAHVVPEFNITVGTMTMPMDRLGESSSGKMAFVEAPITVTQQDGVQNQTIARQAFGNPVTLGIRLHGDIGPVHYIAGVGNGDSHAIFNTTRQLAYGFRLWVDALGSPGYDETDFAYSETPQIAIGVGTAFDNQNAVDSSINFVTLDWAWSGSGDLIFKWKGFTLLSEAYFRRLKVATGSFTLDDFGYHTQLGYFVIPKKLEFVARGAQMFREGPNNNAYEFAGGLNWYIKGRNVKFQIDYSRLVDFDATAGTGGIATDRIRSMLTFQI